MSSIGEGFASSEHYNMGEAADQIFEEARENLGEERADLGLLFLSTEFKVEEFVDHLGEKMFGFVDNWVGCTTAGEISKEGSTLGGAVLVLINLDKTDIEVGISRNVYEEPVESGRKAVQTVADEEFLNSDKDKAVFTLMPGLTEDQPGIEFEVLKGMNKELESSVPIVGGSSGDDMKFKGNKQIFNGGIYSEAVIAVSFLTEHSIAVGKEHGFKEKINSGVVSKAEGRIIQEISGKPALEFYSEAVNVDPDELKGTFQTPTGVEFSNIFKYSLQNSIAEELKTGELRLLTPLDITDENGIVMTVEVDENSLIHIVQGGEQDIVEAGMNAFKHVEGDVETFLALVSDCTCRNQLMDDESLDKEVGHMREFLDCPVVGFYGYGEIGGTQKDFCTFQNQTVSGLLFYKEED